MQNHSNIDFSCGVRFLTGLSNSHHRWDGDSLSGIDYDEWRVARTSDESILADLRRISIVCSKQYLFSDIVREEGRAPSPGQRLANLIASCGWGELVQGPIKVNQNSGNKICVWIWSPNKEAEVALNRY